MALAAIGATLASFYSGFMRVCRLRPFPVAGSIVNVKTCDPLMLVELMPFLIGVVVLLWPDISSIGLFGLNLAKRQEQIERQVMLLFGTATPAEEVIRSIGEKEREWGAGDNGRET